MSDNAAELAILGALMLLIVGCLVWIAVLLDGAYVVFPH